MSNNILDSRFYSIMETISFFFLLNTLYLIMCIPIITIFPATAAMFGVIRQYVMKKDNTVFKPFFRFFKENFKQSFILSIIVSVILYVLYIDFMLINTLGQTMQNLLLASLFLIMFMGGLTFVYVFPTMVHYRLTLWMVVKNSFLFALKYFPSTLLSIILLVLAFFILMFLPVTFLMIFSIVGYLVFLICYSRFVKEEEFVKEKLAEASEG